MLCFWINANVDLCVLFAVSLVHALCVCRGFEETEPVYDQWLCVTLVSMGV